MNDFDIEIARDNESMKTIIEDLRKENESLKNRNKQLEDFCQEFVYGEENPEYYSTMTSKIKKLEDERDSILSVDTLVRGLERSSRPLQRVINTSSIEICEENGRLNLRIKSLEDLLIFCHRSGILGMSYSEGLNQEVDYVYKSLKILSIDYSSDISEKDYEKYIQERLK